MQSSKANGKGLAPFRPRRLRADLDFQYPNPLSQPTNGAFENQIGASVGAVSHPTAERA